MEDIKILEHMLNKESSIYKKNRRGNKEIKFEVDSNYYKAIENLLQENKASKETINILTNKLEKVVAELNSVKGIYYTEAEVQEIKEELEQYKMLHLKSVASRVCNDLKTSEKHKEDLEMLYAGCQEELKNSIPISVIQNKKKYWEQEHHIAGEHLVVQVLDEILEEKE